MNFNFTAKMITAILIILGITAILLYTGIIQRNPISIPLVALALILLLFLIFRFDQSYLKYFVSIGMLKYLFLIFGSPISGQLLSMWIYGPIILILIESIILIIAIRPQKIKLYIKIIFYSIIQTAIMYFVGIVLFLNALNGISW